MTHRHRVERILEEIDGVAAQYGVTSWEREFLHSIDDLYSLTPKQEAILDRIEEKVFSDDGE
jgi:NAD-dependent DNA ligase